MGMKQEVDNSNGSIKRAPLVLLMILGAFLATLNQTIMSVAFPEIMNDFGITATTAQWLTTGYLLVNGVLIPITAYLMHRFTTRELFQSAMILFLTGTLLSAVAGNYAVLLSGRLIQAAGAGIIMPLLMHVILTLYPPEKRGAAMGMVGLAVIFAPPIGPTLAGYVMEQFSWRTIFYSMVPIAVLVIASGFVWLQNVSERSLVKLDLLSAVLSTVGFGILLYGFSRAGAAGWSSWEVLLSLGGGGLALALFTWRQLASAHPLLDLRAFQFPMSSLTTAITIAVTIAMYADMILLPLYLQNARGYTPMESGLLLLPGSLVMGVLMPITGKLFDRFGAKWLAVCGLLMMIATTFSFTNLTDSTSYAWLILMSTGRRIGMALILMPVQTAGLNQLPIRLHAHGTAISNTVKQVAGAVGTSLLITVMTNSAASHLKASALSAAGSVSQQRLLLESTIQGINDAYLVIIGICMVGLLLSLLIRRTEQPDASTSSKPLELQPELPLSQI
jgi:EmrB/QacA subfamily drug resistance transporter